MDIIEKVEALAIQNRQKSPVFVHGSSKRQLYFAFPKFMMDYILKNPKSSKLWEKLIRTCKWFFDKNPIVVISCLHFGDNFESDGFATCSTGICEHLHDHSVNIMKNESFKLWITQALVLEDGDVAADFLIPRIYKCDAADVNLFNQILTFEEFLFLTPEVVDPVLASVIFDKDDKIVSFEKILESLTKAESISYSFKPDGCDSTPDTIKKIAEMEHVKNFYRMTLHDIPTTFDFDAFSKFMLENKQIWFVLCFYDQTTTEEYMVKVKAFATKLNDEDYGDFRRPRILFNHEYLVNGDHENDY